MHHELKEIFVDPTRYEEAVEEMMRRGDEWDKISRCIDNIVKEVESIRERIDILLKFPLPLSLWRDPQIGDAREDGLKIKKVDGIHVM